MGRSRSLLVSGRLLLILASSCLAIGVCAQAQVGGPDQAGGYQVGEQTSPAAQPAPADNGQPAAAVRRLARFDYVSGKVTWRPDESAAWSKAAVNLPLGQGAQIRVTEGGRAEVRFDDGSLLRLGNGAVVTLQTLYSDDQGEFTQMKMISGLATLRLLHEHSLYQVDTPVVTIQANGPTRARIGVGDTVEVGVRLGSVTIEGEQGKTTVHEGNYLTLSDASSPYTLRPLPAEDSWERWNDQRDRELEAGPHPVIVRPHPAIVPAAAIWLGLDLLTAPSREPYWYGRASHGPYWSGRASHWDDRGDRRHRRR